MTGYETIKMARKAGTVLTVEMLASAVDEQKALVSALAIESGVASGEAMAALKLSPFPIEAGESIESRIVRTVNAIRHLSKLVYWHAKVASGGTIEAPPVDGTDKPNDE